MRNQSLFQSVKNFINNTQPGNIYKTKDLRAATSGIENITAYKRMNNNLSYVTCSYQTLLKRLGFIKNVKRGSWLVVASIPEWLDCGVMYLALYNYCGSIGKNDLYHGLKSNEWYVKIKETISYQVDGHREIIASQPVKVEIVEPKAVTIEAKERTEEHILPNTLTENHKPSYSKLTDAEWVSLTRLFVAYVHQGLRAGQSYMVALNNIRPDLYNDLTPSSADCFYLDSKIVAFIKYLNSKEMMKLVPKLGNVVRIKENQRGVVYKIDNSDKIRMIDVLLEGAGAIHIPSTDVTDIVSFRPIDNGNKFFSTYFNV